MIEMASLPDVEGEFFWGWTKALPDWRGQERQSDPAAISAVLGFSTADLDLPADSPAILVRRARKHAGTRELAPAFETAAALPDYMPAELHADAWKQAHRIAAGAAMEHPQEADSLHLLARGALRYAKKFARKRGVPQGAPVVDLEAIDQAKEAAVAAGEYEEAAELRQKYVAVKNGKPVRRWKDSRGLVHSPKPPKETCVEQSPGPRGGRIWDCSGNGKEKPKERPQPAPEAAETPKTAPTPPVKPQLAPSIEKAQQILADARTNPDANKVAQIAALLATMPKEELRQLKRLEGVRADDNTKIGLANKIAKAATVRLTQREYWMQEARKTGVRPEDMLLAARDIRETHNRLTDTVNRLVAEARESYQKQFGKLITRRMKAFEGGDYNQIRGFDVLAREMAGRYPEILGNQGYEGEQGTEAAQKLFSLFAAGRQGRMSFGDSQKSAIGLLHHPQKAQEATPFARRHPHVQLSKTGSQESMHAQYEATSSENS